MPQAQHPDYPAEQAHLSEALAQIGQERQSAAALKASQRKTVEDMRRRSGGAFSDEWFVAEKMFAMTTQKLRNLTHAAQKPYFARIDFIPEQKPNKNTHYIGKWGVLDPKTQTPYIVDWRSPIANLYYGGQVGPASYIAPGGERHGEITLKRIFTIDAGKLKSIIEADIISEDEYLNDVLSDHANDRLRDIVTTIQSEQNQIIRHDYHRPLVVQGVAGAGKTTVALHRITWLLYTYQQTMAAENLMVIAPTPLFLNYISAVLPELGAENVLQTTFYGLARLLCGVRLPKLDDSGMLLRLLTTRGEERTRLIRASRFKGSLAMRACVQAYAQALEERMMPDADFTIGKQVVMSAGDVRRMYCEELKPFPMKKRLPQVKKNLTRRMDAAVEDIKLRLEAEVVQRANYIRAVMPEDSARRRERMQALYQARDEKLEQLDAAAKDAAQRYLEAVPKLNLMERYREFLNPEAQFALPEAVDEELWADMCIDARLRLDGKRIETADLAPIILLCRHIGGYVQRLDIHHTVLDEAQDFSAFQFDILRELTHNQSFTIVGDLTQGIHAYRGVTNWADMMQGVFGETRADYRELVTSYRNTMEIMQLAGHVAAKFPFDGQQAARPVLRHGEIPRIARGGAEDIIQTVRDYQKAGMKTVAIVQKMPQDCADLHKRLKREIDAIALYRDGDDEYHGGVMVIPAHLVKGLEFDAVILADVSAGNFPLDELHCRLLYVCLTRPLHRLSAFYEGELSPLLLGAPELLQGMGG